MPINTPHPEFNDKKSQVTVDAYEGDVMDYIPQLTKQTQTEYEAYRQRGVFFNVTRKTTEAMVGAILRKPAIHDVVEEEVSENITMEELTGQILRDVLLQGRSGILTDWNEERQSPMLIKYCRSNIINWRDDMSLIVLEESLYEENPDDAYELVAITQYRELFLDDAGNYSVRIWRKTKTVNGRDQMSIIEESTPSRRGEPLKFIPFTFVTPFDTTINSYEPVLLNLAQLNLSHFKTTVDIEHGCHFTALPQPYIAGDFSDDMGTEVAIGSDSVWQLESDAKVGYLEFSGAGLSQLESRLVHKEEQMSTIGVTMLTHKGVESAEALSIKSGSQTATLNNVVTAVESGLRQALTFFNYWNGKEQEAQFQLNRDYFGKVLSAVDMKGLMELYLSGGISQETFLENLYEGEITPTVAEELVRLQESAVEELEEAPVEEPIQ